MAWNGCARNGAVSEKLFSKIPRGSAQNLHEIVTDADEMHRLYAREFGIDATDIAYGANIETSQNPEVLKEYGVEPLGYYLIASRMIPDNNAGLDCRGVRQIRFAENVAHRRRRGLQGQPH